jgi:hypothetical protein
MVEPDKAEEITVYEKFGKGRAGLSVFRELLV